MALIKWSPLYEPFLDIERAFEDMRSFAPAVDLYEKGDDLVAEVALAGIDPEKVKLHVEDSVLNIEGSLEKKTEVDEANYYRKEVRSGAFHRVINLPASVQGSLVKAEYEKGILKITMPKKEETKSTPITIEIKK